MTIVVTGGAGFIGTKLSQKLLNQGHTVIVVDIVSPGFTHEKLFYIQCDLTKQELPFNVLEKTDAVINLAGKTIFKKWTEKNKKEIRDSRILSTQHVVHSMKGATSRPPILINASAVGFYGDRGDEELTERSQVGKGFLADLAADWEYEALKAEEFGTRVVCIRTATVIGHGGLFATLKKTSRFGFLLALSKKNFWQPWIHEVDLIQSYIFALETNTVQGAINAVAPEAVQHNLFMKAVAKILKRKVIGVLPSRIAQFVFGSFIEEITNSQKIVPQRLLDKGFTFSYPTLLEALRALKHEAN